MVLDVLCDDFLKSKEDIIVAELVSKYSEKLEEIKQNYYFLSISINDDKLISNMKNHSELIICIVNDILSFFKETLLCDCIFLNGSFSRLTCTYCSDVDFNLIYDSKYKDVLFPIELKINYILSKILNFRGCDRVHTMMVYTKQIGEQYVELLDDKYLVYKDNTINYFCRKNYEKLLNDTFNTCRDYSVLTGYLNENISCNNIFRDWLFNFKVLYEKDSKFSDFVNDNFHKVKIGNGFNNKLIFEIDELIKEYSNIEFDSIYLNGMISISRMKKRYKSNIIDAINMFLLILNYFSSDVYMDFYSLVSAKIVKGKLKECILFAFTIITRLQIVLDRLGHDLSSHSLDNVSKEVFGDTYYEIYKSDYVVDLEKLENIVYSEIINSLKEIRLNLESIM